MGSECTSAAVDTTLSANSPAAQQAVAPPHQNQQRISLPDPASLLKAKIHIAVNRVMATYLSNLEQLADEHDEAMRKLMDVLPADQKAKVHLADIYGEVRFEAIRKHVLKSGNDQVRELGEFVDYLRLPANTSNQS